MLVHLNVWNARVRDIPSRPVYGVGERSGAIDEAVAALDPMVGIGADHRQLPRGERFEQRGIVLGRLGLVVEQAGADHEIGVFGVAKHDIEAQEDRPVALRSEMKNTRSRLLAELVAGEVAGGDRRIIGVVGDAQLAELLLHARAWSRRIG